MRHGSSNIDSTSFTPFRLGLEDVEEQRGMRVGCMLANNLRHHSLLALYAGNMSRSKNVPYMCDVRQWLMHARKGEAATPSHHMHNIRFKTLRVKVGRDGLVVRAVLATTPMAGFEPA